MIIQEDYSYVSDFNMKLAKRGLADLDVYTLHIEGSGENDSNKIHDIVEMLNKTFIIYQYEKNDKGEYKCGYKDNWDLFFWSNWNLKFPLNDTRFNFNEKRSYVQRQLDINRISDILSNYNENDIKVRKQYHVIFHENEILKLADEIYSNIKDEFIDCFGKTGKIKLIQEYKDSYYGSTCKYGFFPKGSKKKYYQITNMALLELI